MMRLRSNLFLFLLLLKAKNQQVQSRPLFFSSTVFGGTFPGLLPGIFRLG
jgi:hypothetical protein